MNKGVIRQLLPIGLAVGLLWYVLKDVPLTDLAKQFRQVNYYWLVLVGGLIGLYNVIRAARWRLTLEVLGYRPTLFRTTVALLAGSMASLLVPGAGELTRCGALQQTDGVPLTQGLGSVVAERIIDVFMLGLILSLTLALEFNRMQTYLSGLMLATPNGYLLAGLAVLAIGSGMAFWWLMTNKAIRRHSFIIKVLNVLRGFKQGVIAIRQLSQPGLFVALTLLNNFLSWLTTYLLLLSLDSTQNLPPTAALTILAVSSLGGLAVPTQGGIGTYHFLVSRALVLYGFSAAQGAVVSTFLHAVGFSISLLLNSVSFLLLPLLIAKKTSSQPEHTI